MNDANFPKGMIYDKASVAMIWSKVYFSILIYDPTTHNSEMKPWT